MKRRSKSPIKSLPIGVIHDEILARLPAKSLLRCRSVSKQWCSIIDNSSFASTHFKKCQNNQEKTRLLVLEPPDMSDSKQICTIRNSEKFRKMCKASIDVTWFEQYQGVGYVNGLLCMKRYIKETQLSKILLWNPSIRKAVDLPFSKLLSKDIKVKYDMDCALGYDPIKKDYKVVTSVYIGNELHSPKRIDVFTLSTFSWKSADVGKGPCIWVKDGPKVCLNGVIYWGAFHDLTKPPPKSRFSQFVSFDVTNDVFEYIDLPENEHIYELEYETFPIILDQSVGFMKVFESYSQIWVMEESKGKGQSWTKRFTIDLRLLQKCIYFSMDGELLFAGEKGGVNSYNIKTRETKVLAKSYKLSPIFICVYMESLALLEVEGLPKRASYTFPPYKTIESDWDVSPFLFLFANPLYNYY